MNSEDLGGLGEISPPELPEFMANYRFYFNPSRYTSLNLAVLEAMAVGLPVIGLATTEMTTVIENGRNGFIDTDPRKLIEPMRRLIADKDYAVELGRNAQATIHERFSHERFIADWNRIFSKRVERSFAAAADTDRLLPTPFGPPAVFPATDVRLRR